MSTNQSLVLFVLIPCLLAIGIGYYFSRRGQAVGGILASLATLSALWLITLARLNAITSGCNPGQGEFFCGEVRGIAKALLSMAFLFDLVTVLLIEVAIRLIQIRVMPNLRRTKRSDKVQ